MISVEEFKQEVMNWAEELKLSPKEIHVRDMSSKWASCSSKGRLSFSKSLLEEPSEVRAKAIVHELLHLKYPNHGKLFKTMLISYLSKKGITCNLDDVLKIN
jgi:predicted metal-dependent hydrolase